MFLYIRYEQQKKWHLGFIVLRRFCQLLIHAKTYQAFESEINSRFKQNRLVLEYIFNLISS